MPTDCCRHKNFTCTTPSSSYQVLFSRCLLKLPEVSMPVWSNRDIFILSVHILNLCCAYISRHWLTVYTLSSSVFCSTIKKSKIFDLIIPILRFYITQFEIRKLKTFDLFGSANLKNTLTGILFDIMFHTMHRKQRKHLRLLKLWQRSKKSQPFGQVCLQWCRRHPFVGMVLPTNVESWIWTFAQLT